jgi:hypothetical protein
MRCLLLISLVVCCYAVGNGPDADQIRANADALQDELLVTEELIKLYERRRALLQQMQSHSNNRLNNELASKEAVSISTAGEVVMDPSQNDRTALGHVAIAPASAPATDNFDAIFVQQQISRWDIHPDDVLIAVLPVTWSLNTTSGRVLTKRSPDTQLPTGLLLHLWSSGKLQAFADVDVPGEGVLLQLVASDGARFETTSACHFARQQVSNCQLTTAAFVAQPEPIILLGYQHGEIVILKVALSLNGLPLTSKGSLMSLVEEGLVLMLQAHCEQVLQLVHSDLGQADAAAVPTASTLVAVQSTAFAVVGTAHGALFVMDCKCTTIRAVMNSFSQEKGISKGIVGISRQAGTLAVGAGDRIHFVQISKWKLEDMLCKLPLDSEDDDGESYRAAVVSVVHDGPSSVWATTTAGDVVQFTVKHKQLSCKLSKRFPSNSFPGAAPCATWQPPACRCSLARVLVSVRGALLAIAGGGVGLINVTSGHLSTVNWKQAPCGYLPSRCNTGIALPLTYAFLADFSSDGHRSRSEPRSIIWRPANPLSERSAGVLVIARDGKTVVYNNLLAQREAAAPGGGLLDSVRVPFMFAGILVFVAVMQCQRSNTSTDAESRSKGCLMALLHYLGIGVSTVVRGPIGHAARVMTEQNHHTVSSLFGGHAGGRDRHLDMSNFDRVVEQMAHDSRRKRDLAVGGMPSSARQHQQHRQRAMDAREVLLDDSNEGVDDGLAPSQGRRIFGDSSSDDEPAIIPRSVYDDLTNGGGAPNFEKHLPVTAPATSGVQRWAQTIEQLAESQECARVATADYRRNLQKARALQTMSPTSEDGGEQDTEAYSRFPPAFDRHVVDPDTYD